MSAPTAPRHEVVAGHEVGEWVAERVRGSYNAAASWALGLGKPLRAGVIYENWNRRSITCHIAIEGRLTPQYLAAIFDYPFHHCAVHKILCPVAASNARSVALVKNMGFLEEARISDAHPEGDLLIFTMTRSACRFLGERYGKELRSAASG